jgi:hypothetical protein
MVRLTDTGLQRQHEFHVLFRFNLLNYFHVYTIHNPARGSQKSPYDDVNTIQDKLAERVGFAFPKRVDEFSPMFDFVIPETQVVSLAELKDVISHLENVVLGEKARQEREGLELFDTLAVIRGRFETVLKHYGLTEMVGFVEAGLNDLLKTAELRQDWKEGFYLEVRNNQHLAAGLNAVLENTCLEFMSQDFTANMHVGKVEGSNCHCVSKDLNSKPKRAYSRKSYALTVAEKIVAEGHVEALWVYQCSFSPVVPIWHMTKQRQL